jgi:hypothetical protein
MRYKPKSSAALSLALGGLPAQMRVKVDPGTGARGGNSTRLRPTSRPRRQSAGGVASKRRAYPSPLRRGHSPTTRLRMPPLPHKFDYSDDPASYLRPGDTLTIEIEVDPSFSDEGFIVKWSSMYVDQRGERLVKFVLPVENRHVGRELPIDIKIISHQDWHRHQVWDDFWWVCYRVLPPM